jgi:4-hydroxy-3-polyprenylbenzoate decarboxylase
VIAAAGGKRRELSRTLPEDVRLPDGYGPVVLALPGVLVVEAPQFADYEEAGRQMETVADCLGSSKGLAGFPLVVLVDDAGFCGNRLKNFLWVTFTRSNPSHDVYGIESFVDHKHWGCKKSLIIDGRLKPHHAPPLEEDPAVSRRVDTLGTKGKPLHGIV